MAMTPRITIAALLPVPGDGDDAGMAGFWSQLAYKETGEWKEEIVYFKPAATLPAASFPDGTSAKLAAGRDPREVFDELGALQDAN